MNAFYITGPTGSGKSAVAMELADRTNGALVNADAYQIYRELSIITARPTAEDEARVSHHLYGTLSTAETCDAGRWLSLAKPCVDSLKIEGCAPLVTGGTGLYIKALTHGLNDVPEADPELREQLNALSPEEIREQLTEIDPPSVTRIDPENRRYLQRALEICLTTGQPASSLRDAWKQTPEHLHGVFLTRPREVLVNRIEVRIDQMFATGAVEEVQAVPEWSETSARAIGVSDIQKLLRREIDEATCKAAISQATRRYAKRQTTWFRRETWLKPIEIDEKESPGSVAERILKAFPDLIS